MQKLVRERTKKKAFLVLPPFPFSSWQCPLSPPVCICFLQPSSYSSILHPVEQGNTQNLLSCKSFFLPHSQSSVSLPVSLSFSLPNVYPLGRHEHDRLTVTASCPMDLQYFPMDRQLCTIEVESCEHFSSIFSLLLWNS